MAGASQELHEPREMLDEHTLDMHRAIVSLQEELEAADWYRQRAAVCRNESLREILQHNMREEIEHASMILEWLRRNDPDFAGQLGTYLFADGNILEAEEAETSG
ncbi:ferritin family protein [Acidihalobacter prosperus]